jgi:hypothetical protein
MLPPSSVVLGRSATQLYRYISAQVPRTMKAAVFTKPGSPMVVEEVLTPVARRGEVVIKVKACGVCHSDLHGNHRTPTF